MIIGDQYWTFSGTGTSTNAARGISRGNVTHGLAVVGLLLDQIVREGDGDTVLSTRIKVLQNLSVQKFNVLEENGGNGENDQRMPSFGVPRRSSFLPKLADTEPSCAPHCRC